jgi:hypothetical protein
MAKKDGKTKLVVARRFRDKNDKKTWYEVDTIIEFDAERAKDVVDRGLANPLSSPPAPLHAGEGGNPKAED